MIKNESRGSTYSQYALGKLSYAGGMAAFAAALALLTPVATRAAPLYTITDLGSLIGEGYFTEAYGINNSGQVVGNSDHASFARHAFRWEDGVMTDLGDPGDYFGASYAYGINDSGQVVGDTLSDAFLWQGRVRTNLGDLPGRNISRASGINNSGQIVGASTLYGTISNWRAFLWQDGVMTDLGDLPGGLDNSYALGINDSGQVVGYSNAATGPHAFLWQDGVITDLSNLADGDDFSVATGINDRSQVVGYGSNGIGASRAVLWQDSVITDLGYLPGYDYDSQAFDINNSGQVVGTSTSISGYRAFLWQDGEIFDLNDLLSDPTGWELNTASAINDSGQIVGSGIHDGVGRGFLLTPVADIREISINSHGEVVGEFNPDYPTVVVTHGWQPTGSVSDGFPLSDIFNAVESRAVVQGQPLNLITYQWEEAYTGTDYNAAARSTAAVGTTLGDILEGWFDDTDYTGNLHMIGHSLGTVVNAVSVNRFGADGRVDQFTILDAPSDAPANRSGDLFLEYGQQYFNYMLNDRIVKYVDNFYGDTRFYGDGFTSVGTIIANAADHGGTALAGLGHTEVHTEFYAPHIGEADWITPIFGLDSEIFSGRAGPQIWNAWDIMEPTRANVVLNEFPEWRVDYGTTGIFDLEDLIDGDIGGDVDTGGTAGTTPKTALVLIPASPVSISQYFEIPGDATLLTFDFGFLDPGTGEFLQLYFDDMLLWEMPWMNDLVGELLNAVVPISALAGLSGDLTFLLDSTNGNAQARAFLTNFQVIGQSARMASVPEPVTLSLLGAGLAGMGWMRRRKSWAC